MKTDPLERRFLLLSALGNLGSAVLGLVFAALTMSQAILLDGLFDVAYFIIALFTLKVARLVHREDDERFPIGYAFFEPLTNGIKGVLVLGISIMALAGAVLALVSGGRQVVPGMAILYGLLAVLLCGALAVLMRRGSHKLQSPLLKADARNWIVNGAISACVLLAFASILVLERIPSLRWAIPYVDPVIVIVVVLLSISVPVRMAWQALMELLNRAPPEEIARQVTEAVRQATVELPVREQFVRVLQPGRLRIVLAHVVLPADFHVTTLQTLDVVRARTLRQLKVQHLATVLDMVFTADRRWGEPVGLTQGEGLTAAFGKVDSGHSRLCPEANCGGTLVKKGTANAACPKP